MSGLTTLQDSSLDNYVAQRIREWKESLPTGPERFEAPSFIQIHLDPDEPALEAVSRYLKNNPNSKFVSMVKEEDGDYKLLFIEPKALSSRQPTLF